MAYLSLTSTKGTSQIANQMFRKPSSQTLINSLTKQKQIRIVYSYPQNKMIKDLSARMNANTTQIVPLPACGKHMYYAYFCTTWEFTDCNELTLKIPKRKQPLTPFKYLRGLFIITWDVPRSAYAVVSR